jgi:hypothetical protein
MERKNLPLSVEGALRSVHKSVNAETTLIGAVTIVHNGLTRGY